MSNVHNIHHLEEIEEQASLWVTKLDRGLTAQEHQALDIWLSDETNHEVFLMMASTWDKVDSLSQLASLFQPSVDKSKRRQFKQRSFAIAASVVFCLLFSWSYIDIFFNDNDQVNVVNQSMKVKATYQTAVGQHSTIDLADGSVLTINTNSLVKINYNKSQRLINLIKGEIFIDVAHDSERPLSVIVDDTVFQAIGTAFNVKKSFEDNIELLVTDGKVLIAELEKEGNSNRANIALDLAGARSALPGEKVIIKIAEQIKEETEKLNSEDMEVSLGWLDRKLIFRGQSLLEAMEEVSRYTDATFIIPQESLQQRKIAGVFKTNDIELLLDTLYENFNIHHKKNQHGKIILVSMD